MQKVRRATRLVSQRRKAKKNGDNQVIIALIIGIVTVFSVVIIINIYSSSQTLNKLKEQALKLQSQYDEQLKLAEELKKEGGLY